MHTTINAPQMHTTINALENQLLCLKKTMFGKNLQPCRGTWRSHKAGGSTGTRSTANCTMWPMDGRVPPTWDSLAPEKSVFLFNKT